MLDDDDKGADKSLLFDTKRTRVDCSILGSPVDDDPGHGEKKESERYQGNADLSTLDGRSFLFHVGRSTDASSWRRDTKVMAC